LARAPKKRNRGQKKKTGSSGVSGSGTTTTGQHPDEKTSGKGTAPPRAQGKNRFTRGPGGLAGNRWRCRGSCPEGRAEVLRKLRQGSHQRPRTTNRGMRRQARRRSMRRKGSSTKELVELGAADSVPGAGHPWPAVGGLLRRAMHGVPAKTRGEHSPTDQANPPRTADQDGALAVVVGKTGRWSSQGASG